MNQKLRKEKDGYCLDQSNLWAPGQKFYELGSYSEEFKFISSEIVGRLHMRISTTFFLS